MSNTIALLERARAKVPRASKRALALKLGMEDANLRRIYRGKGWPNPVHCERLAAMLGLDPLDVIRYVQEDKAKSDEDREFLRAKLPRILPTAGFALAWIVGASLTTTGRAQATVEKATELTTYTLCALIRLIRASLRRPSLADPVRDPSLFRLPRGASITAVA